VDGRILGTWKLNKRSDHQKVFVEPFETLASSVQASLEAEVKDLSRFLNIAVSLEVAALS
jgi:hypothetical protein